MTIPRPRRRDLSASPCGFCAGAGRATQAAEVALEQYGAPVSIRHEIVHDKYIVKSLRTKGANLRRADGGGPEGFLVMVSAYGAAPIVHAGSAETMSAVGPTAALLGTSSRHDRSGLRQPVCQEPSGLRSARTGDTRPDQELGSSPGEAGRAWGRRHR
ncbi:hypothetical protein ACH427_27460 [Streptomyces sp. NPDC020379]|uniref:hypothetical protein n=1 Tax=Streptomyces sp. NPDC020379 TaxID=3365071 RepID=UPI0037A32EA8